MFVEKRHILLGGVGAGTVLVPVLVQCRYRYGACAVMVPVKVQCHYRCMLNAVTRN